MQFVLSGFSVRLFCFVQTKTVYMYGCMYFLAALVLVCVDASVYECQRVKCAFTSPVRTECGMFVMCCMQCCMSASSVLYCVDVLSRGGI